jgi:small-conductance mechanosensitive channel
VVGTLDAAVVTAGATLQTTTDTLSIDPRRVLEAAVVLAVAYLAARTISFVLTAVADRLVNQRFRVTLLIPLVKFLIYGLAAYLIVRVTFDLSTTQLVAFSGLLGAALGLGLKDFLADVVGGLVVVLEQPYQVGDKVTLGEHYGEIVDIGIRSTKLVTPNDTLVVVPNFFFFNDSIANANTSEAQMLVVVEFYVSVDADVDRAREIISEAMATSQHVYVSDAHPYKVVVEDNLYYRTLKGKAYVNDLRNEFAFKTDVTERVLATFDDEGIESPKAPAPDGSQSRN